MGDLTSVHMKVVLIDETCDWPDDIVARAGGRICQAYLFDSQREVHCCEVTPSYELYPIYICHGGDDATDDEIRQCVDNEVVYMHCSSIDRMSPRYFHDYGPALVEADETWESTLEEWEEHCRGNPPIYWPREEAHHG